MPPGLRRLALIAHVTSSVGWIGAIAAFLAVSLIGVTSPDPATVRGSYLVMEPAARYVLVPLALASLVTGLIQSLGTPWGMFRHYWVLFKLVITLLVTAVLLLYLETFRHLAAVAGDPGADIGTVRNASPALHAALAILVLLVNVVLAVHKPRGLTPYGQRRRREQRRRRPTVPVP